MSSVKLNLRELLDIALPAPELDVINFHILHKLLNAMIEALQMDEMNVDLSSSSLIPSKDESTETEILQMIGSGSENENGDEDSRNDYYNRTPNQTDREYIEAAENMAKKLSEMDTQMTGLNDYVIRCMQTISASVGLKNLPRPSTTEAEMAADNILCGIIESVETVPVTKPVFDRISELELDQLKQWDDVVALTVAFEKYAKETDALLEDVKLLKCKSKQITDDFTRFATNTDTTFVEQSKTNETMDKRMKTTMNLLEREKKLQNCSLKAMECMLEHKVDKYELESVKEYVKSKVKELRTRPYLGSKKIVDETPNDTEMPNRNISDATSKATAIDAIKEQWKAYSNTLTLLNDADMTTCVCSYVKGVNGSVYRSNCVCCKPKTSTLPNI